MNNYIALLGTGFARRRGVLHDGEMAEAFRLDRVSKSPAVFDEQKLRHMNGQHLRALSVDELTERLERFTGRTGLRGAVEISREKIQTLADFWPLAGFLFDGPTDDPKAFAKVIGADGGRDTLAEAREALVADRAVHGGYGRGGAARDRGPPGTEARPGVPAGACRDRRGRRSRRGSSRAWRCSGRERTIELIDRALAK